MGKKQADRFFDNIEYEPMSGCWLYISYPDRGGYGKIRFNNKHMKAHRVSWIIHNNEIPINKLVLHKCDNPACVNPKHLFIGTQKDNMRDMVLKGRKSLKPTVVGENSHRAKFTETDIINIRNDPRNNAEIAREYCVTTPAIRSIKIRKTWKHVG